MNFFLSKTYFLLIFPCFLLACTHSTTGYINPNKLVEDYHGAANKRQTFLNQTKIWQANLDSLTTEISALPPAQAKQKEQEFLQYRQVIQQKAQVEEARVNKAILTEVNAYIKQYGKEKGYDFILGATESGNIVYAAEETDLTDEILAGLNQQYDQRKESGK
jgi:outer membrane protein